MTWARTRTRANNNVIHVKQQESMGIGANAAARIDREHSLNHAAIDKASAELRLEVAIREKQRKELEFLEKGGNPLDFEYGDAAVSVAEVVLSESEAKERKLFVLQNKNLSNGIVAEIRKGLDSIKGQVSNAESQLLSTLSRFARNGDSCELSKQVLRRGTLPSIVRVKEEKNAQASNSGSKLETGDSNLDGKAATTTAENGPAEKTTDDNLLHAKDATEQQESFPALKKDEKAEANGEAEDSPAAESTAALHVQEDKNEKADSVKKPETAARNEDDILQAAKVIQAARELASRKPVSSPARRKSHWDYVLEEMAWMANDFKQERLWKLSAAAHVCRSASQAPFWANAEKKVAGAAVVKESVVKVESMDEKDSSERSKAPLERFAYTFLTSTTEPPSFTVPCAPEVEERVLPKKLHFIIPHGASEAFKLSVERSWSSKLAGENDSEPDEDSFSQGKLLTAKREVDGLESALKKKRKVEGDVDMLLEDDTSEFFDVPVKRQRTSGVAARQRSDKKSKKGGKPNRLRFMNKGTDSENEWMPEAVYVEKPQNNFKRKKDQLVPFKTKDELTSSKKARLSRLGESSERLKKSSLRKGEFLHVSINQPGNGVPWSSLEDQAIIVLEHDFGPNWELLSDILNAGSHLKGHFRSPKDCKERHILLLENMPLGSEGFPGVTKGTGMMMLQKMQGPMEADTVKFHLEQIIQVRNRYAEIEKDYPHDTKQQPHKSFAEAVGIPGPKVLSPLDFADQPVIQKIEPAPLPVPAPPAEAKPTVARQNAEMQQASEPQHPPKPVRKVVQKTTLEDKDKPGVQQTTTTVKQEPVHRPPPDNAKAEQQLHRLQQFQTLSHKQRNWEQKDHPMQPHPRMAASAAMLASGRPSFQQKKAAAPLPPCSTSQQHQEPPPSFSDQHQHQHQHPQLQPAYRIPPPQGGMGMPQSGMSMQQGGMGMQQQQQQPQSFHYNHRCFTGPGPRYSPAAQWRAGQSGPGMFSQMSCLGGQVGPSAAVDAAAFQQARFQSPGMNPRSMKQQQQMPRAAVQQQQQPGAHHYLPSSVAGAVRYTYSGAQPGYHHPVYNNGKAWQQQAQGNGGAAAAAAAVCVPPAADPAAGGGLDPSSSCK